MKYVVVDVQGSPDSFLSPNGKHSDYMRRIEESKATQFFGENDIPESGPCYRFFHYPMVGRMIYRLVGRLPETINAREV